MNQPNGLTTCFQCKVCDQEQGFYYATACTIMRDAVCGVLDGYYCTSNKNQECTLALKHRQCDPGEEIKAPVYRERENLKRGKQRGRLHPALQWTALKPIYAKRNTGVKQYPYGQPVAYKRNLTQFRRLEDLMKDDNYISFHQN
ncbi:hypothetical protein NFI96_011519 [Prochilodus magdalenae]|nr:hypothetical protein NFI96_011519 [Prochilodus magdalenae]